MKKITILIIAISCLPLRFYAQMGPIEVTGFNADIVANGVGPMTGSTTHAADDAGFCLISEDWKLNAGDPPITVGLPASGLITSTAITGLTYQIQPTATPYSGNNSLRVDQSGAANAGVISLVTPANYTDLYFLVFTGSGTADMDVTLNFSDGTSENFANNSIPDWYQTGLPIEVQGFGRGSMNDNNVETPAGNPKLFRLEIDVSTANESKAISTISFTRNNPASSIVVFNMMAISGIPATNCFPPSNVVVSNIGTTSADVSWGSTGLATEWEIEYGLAGFVQGSGTLITDNDGTIGESLSGLTPATDYELYVRGLCPGEQSVWSGPIAFTTACPIITTFPYTQSFEDTSADRRCWTNEHVSGIVDWEYTNTNLDASISPRTGTLMAQFSKVNPSGETTKLLSPALDLTSLASPQLVFYFANVGWSGDIDELKVYYKTSSSGTWTQIGSAYTAEHTSWTKVELALPNPSSDYYIAFEGKSNFGRGVDLDDVWIGDATCAAPTNIVANNETNTSADISWTPGGTETEWEIEYGLTGFAQGSGTIVSDNDGTLGVSLTALASDTGYDVYVRSICSSDTSGWVGPETFNTLLGINDVVFEGFSYYPNPVSRQLLLEANFEIQQVVVYDLQGREVMKTKPGERMPVLELGQLQKGTYMMKISINDVVQVYKVLKE